jgi:hypothetical protein
VAKASPRALTTLWICADHGHDANCYSGKPREKEKGSNYNFCRLWCGASAPLDNPHSVSNLPMIARKKGCLWQKNAGIMDVTVNLWLHSQQSVLLSSCVALTRPFFEIGIGG